ncbi:hypothetical protein VB712_09615 [Spirulina sp. CCNP1310]|uniref:DUF7507 domain-containing protein n=1 Tax=Spirulina sp. CCNP1310 TaxID=3110249 RepID=UPI002B1FC34D|nr:hypothetical protein [Spirulina sp. CCNP1310]MEA5419483.1 hypothetical protein [Spirulina sp. CCNP1310]
MFRVSCWITLACLLLTPTVALAEGSKELKGTGDRPLLLYRDGAPLAGIPRQNKMFVYANAGEIINLGSSAVGVNQGRIDYIAPDGTTGVCNGSTGGLIRNVTEENAGPFGGYTPCQVVVGANQAGIWQVQFVSPNPSSTTSFPDVTSLRTAINNWSINGRQANNEFFVTAWDITVTNNQGSPVTPGRVFMNYFPGRLGQGAVFDSRLYVLTEDGFQYRIAFTNLDPDGFTLFANNKGFRNGTTVNSPPIFQSVNLSGDASGNNVPSGISIHSPDVRDDSNNITHRLFVNPPSPDLPNSANIGVNNIENWLRREPEAPPEPQNFRFVGQEGTVGQAGSSPLTGRFIFTNPSSKTATYTIGLDLDRDGQITNNSRDRILLGIAQPGENIIPWDGLDGQGNPVPPGDFTFRSSMTLAIGEVHFPLLDPENNNGGFTIQRLNNPPVSNTPDPTAPDIRLPADPFLIYYNNAPSGGQSAIAGIDSTNGAHRWTSNFGNEKGIDTWVNVPSPSIPAIGGFTIKEADLQITKRLESNTDPIAAGSTVTYIIEVLNPEASPSGVQNVPVTDVIPSAIRNVTWTCAGQNGGLCNDISGSGNNVNTTANLPRNSKVIYTITGIVDLASVGETLQNTARVTRPNDVNDPNINNNQASTVPVIIGPPLPTTLNITKAPTTGQTTVSPGETLSYTIIVENTGTAPAFNVTVNDPIPTGLTFESNSGDCDTAYVCQLGTIPAGETRTILTTFTIPADYQGPDPIDNIAVASALNIGPDPVTSNTVSLSLSPLPPQVADLEVLKTGPDVGELGDTLEYTITARNLSSTVAATGVILRDRLTPNSNIEYVNLEGGIENNGVITWNIGTIPANGTVTRRVQLRFTAQGSYDNIAFSESDNDPNPNNNNIPPDDDDTRSITTDITTPNLTLNKEGPTTFNPGDLITYNFTINNPMGQDALGVILTHDDLTNLGFTFQPSSVCPSLPCNLGTIPAGETLSFDLSFLVPTDYSDRTPIPNTTSLIYNNNPNPNQPIQDNVPTRLLYADLVTTKTGQPWAFAGAVTYTIRTENIGSDPAINVRITDEISAGVTATAISNGGRQEGNLIIWDVANLPAGEDLEYTVTLPLNEGGSYTNIARSRSDTFDPEPSNNNQQRTTDITPVAELIVRKNGETSGQPGPYTYNITARNDGPSTAENVVIKDELDPMAEFISASDGGVYDPVTNTVSWNLGNLAAQQSKDYTVTVRLSGEGEFTNRASGTSTTPDPQPGNNSGLDLSAMVKTEITLLPEPEADLIVTKDPEINNTPGQYSYKITAFNDGPDRAENVVIQDQLAPGAQFVSASDGGVYDPVNNTVSWAVGDLENKEEVSRTVTVQLLTADKHINRASGRSDTTDPEPRNNDGSSDDAEVTTIIPDPDPLPALSLIKTGPQQFNPGDTITYNFTIENTGNTNALNVVLTDEVLTSLGFTFQPSSRCPDLPCDLGTIPPGLTTFALDFLVPPDYTDPGVIPNLTMLTYSNNPNPDQPIQSAVPTRLLNADLITTKRELESGILGEYTYQIKTYNNGDDPAVNVRISDEIPAGVTVLNISHGGRQEGNLIIWDVPNLEVGEQFARLFTVTLRLDTPGLYTNIARSTSDTFDPLLINNDGSNAVVTTEVIVDPDPDPVVLPNLNLIAKDGPERFNPGQLFTYTVVLDNDGDADALNVILDNPLFRDLGFEFQPSDICPTLPCSLGNLPKGERPPLTLTFRVPDTYNDPGILEYPTVVTYNQTADDAEPINLNVKLEAELPVADLETDMDRVELTPNEQELKINTTNLGPNTAENVNVVLELPDGVQVLEISPGGQQVGNTIVWPVGDLGPNQSVENFVRVAINEQEEGESFAIARSSSDTFDRDSRNNNGSRDSAREPIKIPVVQEPTDVAVKITPPASFQPGEMVEFTYVITNEGDVLATNVAFATTPIPGLEFLSQGGDDCSPDFGCNLGDLPPGQSRTIIIRYQVPQDFAGTSLETAATVTADNDRNLNNNQASRSIPRQTGEPGLELLKRITNVWRNGVSLGEINFNQVVSPPPSTNGMNGTNGSGAPWQPVGVMTIPSNVTLESGDVIEYTLYLRSSGAVAVENVRVCDLIPNATTFVPDSFGAGQGMRLVLGDEVRLLSNGADGDRARYLAPLNPVAAPCQNTNNPNGAVVVEGLTLEPGTTGAIQFRVRLD